jgi:predicted ArsR family transcriptional regulator
MPKDLGAAAGSIGALEDELRRRMYLFIRHHGRPVSREEAAGHAGISRKLAAFHLDKLVEKGLLKVHYARPPGRRSGRGAGRSSKLYEPSETEISVSLPERRYDVVSEILTEAIQTRRDHEAPEDAARRIAHDTGVALGQELAGKRSRPHLRPARVKALVRRILSERGYEPYPDGSGGLRLRNCPFYALSRRAPELICELNQRLVDGLVRGLGNESLEAVLDRQPNQCCIHVKPSDR